jgi:DNA-binding transcriptional ArsR family regulator
VGEHEQRLRPHVVSHGPDQARRLDDDVEDQADASPRATPSCRQGSSASWARRSADRRPPRKARPDERPLAAWPHRHILCPRTWEERIVTESHDRFWQQAQVLKALAHPTRLKIVDRLARGSCSVGELTDLVGSDRTTVSKHLAVLRSHGIVRDRRQANSVHYTLLTPCVTSFFSCATQLLEERP